jgi:predicted ester cyclase
VPDANLSLAHRYVEQFLGKGLLEVGDEVLSPDITVITGLSPSGPILGLASYKQIFGEFFAAFPPVEPLAIIDSFAAEDRAVVRFNSRQRHEGTYFGIAPTGRVVLFDETHVMRIKDGRVVENIVSATNLEFEMLMAPVLAPAILGGSA